MSAKYPYLDIAISVLGTGAQPVNYSFNSAPTIALPSLSELARHFVNLSEGYVMWNVNGRRAYTFFQLNKEGTATELAITLRLDPDVVTPGRPIINLLGTIRRTITDGTRLTHEALMRALTDAGFPEEPLRSDADTDLPTAAVGLCCRTFISTTELANIMAYPRQADYAPYQGVIVVNATVSMNPESSIPVITTPVDKALMVVCPEGVKASAAKVELSDRLTVTYYMAGFDPQSVDFEVGTTNRYARIPGPALVINPARHAGIIFRRSVPYTVMSATGSPIDTYTILVNGRTATRSENSFEMSNTDFPDGKVTIAVSSTNFGSYSQEFTPEELSQAIPLEIVLEPEARKVCLRLDFGNGRIIEDSITLEKSTPEYNRLRAGNFHGFRAHRLMGSNPETYNIDVRQPAQPIQPALDFNESTDTKPTVAIPATETPAADSNKQTPAVVAAETPIMTPQRHKGPVAPKIEKAPTAVWEETPHKRVAPKFENVATGNGKSEKNIATQKESTPEKTDSKTTASSDNGTKQHERKVDFRLIIIGMATIAAALIAWWIILLVTGDTKSDINAATQQQGEMIEDVTYTDAAGQGAATTTTTSTATNAPADPQPAQPVAAANADEKADVEYLNNNNVWKLSDLKTEKYRALITDMQKGDIQGVASNPYFAIPGTATNKKAEAVIGYLWKAKGSQQEKRNVEKLRDLTKADKADLPKLIDDLSRYQPKEGNTAPRPGAQ